MPKPKERTFRVTSYETCHFEQIVKVPEVYTDGEYDQGETEGKAIEKAGDNGAVSYTHLTLPTIYSV